MTRVDLLQPEKGGAPAVDNPDSAPLASAVRTGSVEETANSDAASHAARPGTSRSADIRDRREGLSLDRRLNLGRHHAQTMANDMVAGTALVVMTAGWRH